MCLCCGEQLLSCPQAMLTLLLRHVMVAWWYHLSLIVKTGFPGTVMAGPGVLWSNYDGGSTYYRRRLLAIGCCYQPCFTQDEMLTVNKTPCILMLHIPHLRESWIEGCCPSPLTSCWNHTLVVTDSEIWNQCPAERWWPLHVTGTRDSKLWGGDNISRLYNGLSLTRGASVVKQR